jgi:hypothetical protein
MTTTPLPSLEAPYVGGRGEDALSALFEMITNAVSNHPRSLQRRIGPSEVGSPCTHCLAAKLAGWAQTPEGVKWRTTVGTGMHAWVEGVVIDHENSRNAVHTTGLQWLTERSVMVGLIGGIEIWGSCDLFHIPTGTVIDHKFLGTSQLTAAKSGPKTVYKTQANLYGLGFENAGHRVEHVAIAHYPRDGEWSQKVPWTVPYDRQCALDALERANHIWANLAALESVSIEARDAWITTQPRAPKCWDCPRYPDGAGIPAPGHHPPQQTFSDLLAS